LTLFLILTFGLPRPARHERGEGCPGARIVPIRSGWTARDALKSHAVRSGNVLRVGTTRAPLKHAHLLSPSLSSIPWRRGSKSQEQCQDAPLGFSLALGVFRCFSGSQDLFLLILSVFICVNPWLNRIVTAQLEKSRPAAAVD